MSRQQKSSRGSAGRVKPVTETNAGNTSSSDGACARDGTAAAGAGPRCPDPTVLSAAEADGVMGHPDAVSLPAQLQQEEQRAQEQDLNDPEAEAPGRPLGWDSSDAEDLPAPRPGATYLSAVVMEAGELRVREADGVTREVGAGDAIAQFFNVDMANADESWVGRAADGRWYYCEDQGGCFPCCRVYNSLAALCRGLWANRDEEATVLSILDQLGCLRFEMPPKIAVAYARSLA